jgi:hypothetical protein
MEIPFPAFKGRTLIFIAMKTESELQHSMANAKSNNPKTEQTYTKIALAVLIGLMVLVWSQRETVHSQVDVRISFDEPVSELGRFGRDIYWHYRTTEFTDEHEDENDELVPQETQPSVLALLDVQHIPCEVLRGGTAENHALLEQWNMRRASMAQQVVTRFDDDLVRNLVTGSVLNVSGHFTTVDLLETIQYFKFRNWLPSISVNTSVADVMDRRFARCHGPSSWRSLAESAGRQKASNSLQHEVKRWVQMTSSELWLHLETEACDTNMTIEHAFTVVSFAKMASPEMDSYGSFC